MTTITRHELRELLLAWQRGEVTPEEVYDDTQATLYAVGVRVLTGAHEVPATWI